MLITCPKCGNDVSSKAYECPNCGHTLNQKETVDADMVNELAETNTFEEPTERYKASFVLGIIALAFILIPIFGFVFGLIGLILAIVKKDSLYGPTALVFNSSAVVISLFHLLYIIIVFDFSELITRAL